MITKIHIIDVALGLLLRRVEQDGQDRTGQTRNYSNFYANTTL